MYEVVKYTAATFSAVIGIVVKYIMVWSIEDYMHIVRQEVISGAMWICMYL